MTEAAAWAVRTWSMFRSWPAWAQVVGWLIGWWLLLPVLAFMSSLPTVAKILVPVVTVGTLVAVGATSNPRPTEEAQPATPTQPSSTEQLPSLPPSPSPTSSPTPTPREALEGRDCVTLACKLATIEEGTYVAEDDPLVDDYQAALDGLAADCGDSEERLGDMAVASQELLLNGGVSESLLSILRNVDLSIPSGSSPRFESCSDVFGAYVVLRGGEA